MKRLFIGVAVLAAGPVIAANWMFVGGNDENEMYLDIASVRPQGKYMKAWSHWKAKTDQFTTTYPPLRYRSAKSLDLYDCQERRLGGIQEVLYEDMEGVGKIAHQSSWADSQAQFRDPIPGSLGETLLNTVCGNRKR